MNIRITRTVGLHQSVLKKVIDLLLPLIGVMKFFEQSKPLMLQNNPFTWNEFFNSATQYRNEEGFIDEDFLIVLTELKNENNWFSAPDPSGKKIAFIHALEWENYIFCEAEYPLAYEVVSNVFDRLMFDDVTKLSEGYIHQEPIGCMNDLCGWKPDITFKLRSADICNDCLEMLSTKTSKQHIAQGISIFESLRKKMVFNTNYQKPLSFEENLPFTIAITKRKLGMTLEPFRKMLLLIDHFDSIIRTAVIMIAHLSFDKIELNEFFKVQKLTDRPSLGSWVDALAILASSNMKNDWGFQLPKDFASKVKGVVTKANESKIVLIRNDHRGHGYIDCHDSSYKNQFMQSLPVIEEIERLLSTLFYRFKYYHIISHSRIAGNQFKIGIHNLSGSNPGFLEEVVEVSINNINEIPFENHVYLVTPDMSKWIDIDPFIALGECQLCHHNQLLIADGKYMLDPLVGHRFEKQNS